MSSNQDEEISSWEESDLKEVKEDDEPDFEVDEEKAEEKGKEDELDLEVENEAFSWKDVDPDTSKNEGGDKGVHEKHLTDSAATHGQISPANHTMTAAPQAGTAVNFASSNQTSIPTGTGHSPQFVPTTTVPGIGNSQYVPTLAPGTGNSSQYVPTRATSNSSFHSGRGFYVVNSTWNQQAQNAATAVYNPDGKYPHDNYSFIALNGPTNGSWPSKNFLFFLFGLLPFVFQMLFLGMLVWSETDELRGTIGENDNPDSEKDGLMGNLAAFIPANANQIIRWTQVTAILAYSVFPGSSLTDIVKAVQIFPTFSTSQSGNSIEWLRFSCTLKLIQGLLATFSTLLLVVTSNQVVDIILNFTAVNFISNLDDHAFHLAKSGDFGPALQKEAKRIVTTDLPVSTNAKKQPRYVYSLIVSALVSVNLLGMIVLVIVGQKSNRIWVTKALRVQFAEETGLNEFSGCFGMNTTLSSVFFSRRSYDSYDNAPSKTSFGYCREDRQWILFSGNGVDPCQISKNEAELARSSKTDSFDISTSFDEPWVSGSGTPLDLYFFDSEQDEDNLYCDSFLGDGKCDIMLNTLGYQYDGGDCCAATCTQSNCGRAVQKGAFGDSNATEVEFPYCDDPKMVPVTIRFDDIKSSRDIQFTEYNVAYDWLFNWEEGSWRNETAESPYFSVICNDKTLLTLYVNERMVNRSETIMIEDGATCSLVVRSSLETDDILDAPILHVNYTIFHTENDIKILTGQSEKNDTIQFKRIPQCYFTKLQKYTDISSMYEGIGESNPAVAWLVEVDTGNSLCKTEDMFIERYIVTKIFFETNGTQQFVSKENQCTWPQIKCSDGEVYSIALLNITTEGNFPNDIHNLLGLKEVKLRKFFDWNALADTDVQGKKQ